MRLLRRQIPILLLAASLFTAGCASTSQFQGMNLQQVFDQGMQAYENEEWDTAIDAFEQVLFGAPASDEAPIARWHLADAFFQKEEYVTAASEFTRFLERYPNHERAPSAALGVCRSIVELSPIIQRDQTDTRRARTSCRAAAQDHPDTPEGERAAELARRMNEKLGEKTFVGGEFYFNRGLYDSAIIYYEDVVENYPGTAAAPKALRKMYMAYREIGYAEEAQETRQRLLDEYPDSDSARRVRQATSGETSGAGSGGETAPGTPGSEAASAPRGARGPGAGATARAPGGG